MKENGKSMVEMLGVLAVIGVLSVSGIMGYEVLMKKHKRNQDLQLTTLCATMISTHLLADKVPTSLEGLCPDKALKKTHFLKFSIRSSRAKR